MDRRTFLKAGLAVGAGPIWLTQQSEITPVGSNSWLFSGQRSIATPQVFPQSIASGDPAPNGIVLWTRVAPEAIPAGSNGAVTWQISRTPNFEANDIVVQGVQPLTAAADFTAKVVLLSVRTLEPWTTYYYRFGFEGVLSNTGRFKTLPAPDMNLPLLRLGYISCQDFTSGFYTAIAGLAEESLDYVVHLGDYIYESRRGTGGVRIVPPFPSGSSTATTLDDYRHLYRTYRSDASLQRLHESFAILQIWDDHEFANDAYQVYHPDNNPNPAQPRPAQRQAANWAWSEYTATAMPFDPQLDPLQSIRIYRSFQFGTLAELVMTDERLYRDGPPCGLALLQRYVTAGCPEMNNPSRTMLGLDQRAWFSARLQSSSANWKIWANEVMVLPIKVINGTTDIYLGLDSWDGYPAERFALLNSLSNVNNLVAITGDIHSFAAGYLKPSYREGQPRIGVEFVGGSVSSSNLVEILLSLDPSPTSAPVPPQLLKQAFPGGVLSFLTRVMNPDLEFFNSSTHGYCVLQITPDKLTCTMKSVSTVRQPNALVSRLASFTVPSGQRRILRD